MHRGTPVVAAWLIRIASGEEAPWVLAEFDAEFAARVARDGRRSARVWYALQAMRSLIPLFSRRLEVRAQARRRSNTTPRMEMMVDLVRDLKYALRSWARTPLFTLLAVAMIGLGMGGALAVFSVIDGVLLKPLAYPGADRLVHIEGSGSGRHGVTYPDIEDIRERARTLESVVAWQGWSVVMRDPDGVPIRRSAASVSAAFFELLGVRPVLGRLFTPEDEPLNHAPVVVLSHEFWQTEFNGARDVVGRSLEVDSTAYTIVGVAPSGFEDPLAAAIPTSEPVLWRARPEMFDPAVADRGWIGFWAIARLRNGATTEQATAEVAAIVREFYPDAAQRPDHRVATFRDRLVRDVRPTLLLLLAAVAGVMLIACANLANLLLSRASARIREVAVRASLGAPRLRLINQLLTETLVLCLLGGAVGLAVAWAGGRAIVALGAAGLPRVDSIGIDARVALVAMLLSVLCALAAGLIPALRLSDTRVGDTLRGASRGNFPDRRGQRFRHLLVIAETALAVMLLAGAGVLLRSASNLMSIDPGFDAEEVLTVRATLLPEAFPSLPAQDGALARIVEAIAAVPDVQAAGAISDLPMSGAVNSTGVPRADRPDERSVRTLVRAITPDYFDVMGVEVREGRPLGAQDRRGGAEVAVVNATFAEALFPGESAIGGIVNVRGVSREIVGVVDDVKEFTLAGGGDAALYLAYAQETQSWMRESASLVVRGRGDPEDLAAVVRAAIRAAEPMVTVGAVRPMRALIDRDVATPRFRAVLIGVFASLALALAAAGTGGLMAYTVARRLPEMGLRMALGATRGAILGLVLRHAAALTIAGVFFGLLGALAVTRLTAGFLFGVSPTDLLAFSVAALTLTAVGIAAGAVPALRAAGADPARTLRDG